MVRINRVYTKVGDAGETHLVGGSQVGKDDLKVAAYGDLDELNAKIGEVLTVAATGEVTVSSKLTALQHRLFDLGAELACPATPDRAPLEIIDSDDVTQLERWIDALNEQLPELKSFVLPGGTAKAALLHSARTICRRAERGIVALSRKERVRPEVLQYMNRLSDLLFVMARYECTTAGVGEPLWQPKKRDAC